MTSTDLVNLALLKLNEASIEDIEDTGDPVARKALLLYEPTLREVLKAGFWSFAITGADLTRVTDLKLAVAGSFAEDGESDSFTFPMLLPASSIGGYQTWTDTGEDPAFTDPLPAEYAVFKYLGSWGIFKMATTFGAVPWSLSLADDALTPVGLTGWTPPNTTQTGLPIAIYFPEIQPWTAAWDLPADFIKLRSVLNPLNGGKEVDKFDMRLVNGTRRLTTGEMDAVSMLYVCFIDDPNVYDPLFIQAFTTLLACRLARPVTGSEKMESDLLAAYHQLTLPDARTSDAQETQSAENHPLKEFLAGSLTGSRGSWFNDCKEPCP